jgi:hypothetical protein
MRAFRAIAGTAAIVSLFALGLACEKDDDESPSVEAGEGGARDLGEIMLFTQLRHLKLWFAGEAGNWPLASYEVEELKEGFDDVVRLHLEHEGATRSLTELVPEFTTVPLAALQRAIKAGSESEFVAAFDGLTAACNRCHAAAAAPFNVIQRPATNPFSNQRFDPTR